MAGEREIELTLFLFLAHLILWQCGYSLSVAASEASMLSWGAEDVVVQTTIDEMKGGSLPNHMQQSSKIDIKGDVLEVDERAFICNNSLMQPRDPRPPTAPHG